MQIFCQYKREKTQNIFLNCLKNTAEKEHNLFFFNLKTVYDARSKGASVHEKRQKKSLDFSSNWRFQSWVFQIWRSDNFDNLWNFSLERSSIFLVFHGTFKRQHPLWKRPLHEKSKLFFCRKIDPPSDRASNVEKRKNKRFQLGGTERNFENQTFVFALFQDFQKSP